MEQVIEDKNAKALLSSYKGKLFEFLVAKYILIQLNNEKALYSSVSENQFKNLKNIENYISKYFPHLIDDLPLLASKIASDIITHYKLSQIETIFFVGDDKRNGGEEDLVLLSKGVNLKVSLKLSKKNTYINTKSAGVKSFFSQYFKEVGGDEAQRELNEFILFEYNSLSRLLHQIYEVDYDPHFKNWSKAKLPTKPGDLKGEGRQALLSYYHKLNTKLYELMNSMLRQNNLLFQKALNSLAGFKDENLLQVICIFEEIGGQSRHFNSILVDNNSFEPFYIDPLLDDKGHFSLSSQNRILQIRLKPMKWFTTEAFKINCSVKFI